MHCFKNYTEKKSKDTSEFLNKKGASFGGDKKIV